MTDTEVIRAIIGGDKDAYREIVDRYQRLVYGVAWSRLGNHDLCEEAAQETFLKAFKYLVLLRDTEKFPAWVARIARNVSITLLRRRRRELRDVSRWQTVADSAQHDSTGDERDTPLSETITRLVAALPDEQREALVLFYLEGKQIKEAAVLAGTSENAMKTRLHRARAALRTQMESTIEATLEQLEPPKRLWSAIAPVLPATPWLKGIGLAYCLFFFSLYAGLVVATIGGYMALFHDVLAENFVPGSARDLRLGIYRRNGIVILAGIPLVLLVSFILPVFVGLQGFYQIVAIASLPFVYRALRRIRVNPSTHAFGEAFILIVMPASFALMGFLGVSELAFFVAMLLVNIILFLTRKHAPWRLDYNLFLRHQHGLLGAATEHSPAARTFSRKELRAFARFLGNLHLVDDYSFGKDGITLRMPPVRLPLGLVFFRSSRLHIDTRGECRAHLGNSDRRQLQALAKGGGLDVTAYEDAVAAAVGAALDAFAAGDLNKAQEAVQAEADEAVFIRRPTDSWVLRDALMFPAILASFVLVLGSMAMRTCDSPSRVETPSSPPVVEVSIFDRMADETVVILLFDGPVQVPEKTTFPLGSLGEYRKKAIRVVEGKQSEFEFPDLHPGTYTIAAAHKSRILHGQMEMLTSLPITIETGMTGRIRPGFKF